MNLPVIATVTPTPTPNPSHSPSRPIPILPYDIITLIIDQLRHDVPTLRACTLTARAWVHRARLHLHRTFTLPVSILALPSLSAGFEFGFPSEEDEEKFRLMGREAPAVLRYADELELKCVTSSHGSRSGRGRASSAPIRTILHLLQHIRVLRIIDADLSTISLSSSCHTQDSNSNSCSWTTALPNLENLTLSKTTFRSPYDVLRLASQFKQLRTLRVEDIVISDTSDHHSSDVEQGPLFEAPPPPIRNLHILSCTKTPNLPSALASHLAEGNTDLRRLHIDTTSDLGIFTKTIGDSLPEVHLSLQEEFCPLWHVHAEGKVSNMTASDVRAAIQPVLNYKNLRVLRLSVQRSPIVRMVQTMEGCDSRILCSPWQVYREAFVGLGLASASDEALSTSDEALSTSDEAFSTSDEALVGLFGKQEGAEPEREDREETRKERFECGELCLSFDARDIQGPRAHISSFESTLRSLSSSNSNETNTGKGKGKVGVESVKFLVKEFIDPVLPDEPARLRRLWGAFVERLQAQARLIIRGGGREVEVGVEFFDRRDFEW